jgi:hypothetical protein
VYELQRQGIYFTGFYAAGGAGDRARQVGSFSLAG